MTSTSHNRSPPEKHGQSYSPERHKSRDILSYQSKGVAYKDASYESFSPQKYSSKRSKSKEKSTSYRKEYPSTSKNYQSKRNVPDKDLDRYKYYR